MTEDKTSYSQSLTHMIKGNLGAGVLGMGSSFAHLGLVGAIIALPTLCLISGYCVHLLVRSARIVEVRTGQARSGMDYPSLARLSLELGPKWAQKFSKTLRRIVDAALFLTQIGVCSVFLVFVVENITSILASNDIRMSKTICFIAIFPVTLLLSFIRTLNRLALASMAANLLQFIGLALIIEYLLRDFSNVNLDEIDKFRPISEMALGFGSTMFAFEGISVVLPIYQHLRQPKLMDSMFGVVNMSFLFIVLLYFIMGLLSFLKYGHNVRDSITLNLPAEPLYDVVRAMFTTSILLTYPLQCYVPNQMVWKWAKKNFFTLPVPSTTIPAAPAIKPDSDDKKQAVPQYAIDIVAPKSTGTNKLHDNLKSATQFGATNLSIAKDNEARVFNGLITIGSSEKDMSKVDKPVKSLESSEKGLNKSDQCGQQCSMEEASCDSDSDLDLDEHDGRLVKYQYYCRMFVVMITFTVAITVPKLNLLMDLVGSFSGAALSLTIPALIHLAVYWDHERGFRKCTMIILDTVIIVTSLMAGLGGSLSSLVSIVNGH